MKERIFLLFLSCVFSSLELSTVLHFTNIIHLTFAVNKKFITFVNRAAASSSAAEQLVGRMV
jgi:hypothetical protein